MPQIINKKSRIFYSGLFRLLKWRKVKLNAWTNGETRIYLMQEKELTKEPSLGVHHICFQVPDRNTVDKVAKWLYKNNAIITNGPTEMKEYMKGYYTVDFHDPDGFTLEVVSTH